MLRYPAGTTKKHSKTLDVFKLDYTFKGAPKNMTFYSTKLPRGNFATVIGVSDDTILTSGTQSIIDYKGLVKSGKKYSMKNYLKYKNTKEYSSILKKIKFVKNPY
ncbi:hypothetical protein [Macrococcus animalis]|uniref:hypothetical protein n=1 Tax=Macrococcus animalis TaxID=3395467 RepID=UPI0039BE0B3F